MPVDHAAAPRNSKIPDRVKLRPVAELLGDILVYLSARGTAEAPGAITQLIISSLDEAAKVPALRNVGRWINVFDGPDLLAFVAAPIFEDVEDYQLTTHHWWAHSGYFTSPGFHSRLADRLAAGNQ